MGFTFGCGFLIVCFMQRMRLKSRDAVVVLVTLKVPEHLWTGLDIELFLENSALCVPCRKLWCLWKMPPLEGWGCEPTLGLSYRCYPLCFFFLFDKRTGLKWYTCLVVIGFLCLDTFKRNKKVALCHISSSFSSQSYCGWVLLSHIQSSFFVDLT